MLFRSVDESLIDAVKLGVFFASFVAAVIGVFLINVATKKDMSYLTADEHR